MHSRVAGELLGEVGKCLRSRLEAINVCFGKGSKVIAGGLSDIGTHVEYHARSDAPQKAAKVGEEIQAPGEPSGRQDPDAKDAIDDVLRTRLDRPSHGTSRRARQ